MSMDPVYQHNSIGSIESLAKALKLSADKLIFLTENAEKFYKANRPEIKKSGGIRQHYTVAPELKVVQKRIVSVLFRCVRFPDYLHGALKGRTPKSSAEKHLKKKVLIKEDIENFFDSITTNNVEKMWLRLFQFHPDVSRALTKLTTLDGRVPQGAPTSSYIANLILWDKEPILVKNLNFQGFTYTRFVDDVTLSTNKTNVDFSSQISDLYGIFFSKGLKPKRKKHEIQRSGGRQEVQGIITNNRKAALSSETRKAIRSEIRLLKLLHTKDQFAKDFRKKYLSCVGKLNWLQQHHPKLAAIYWVDLKNIQPSLSSSEKNQLNSEVMKLEAIARRQGCVSKRAKKGVSDLLDGLSTVDKDWVRPYRSRIKNIKLAVE